MDGSAAHDAARRFLTDAEFHAEVYTAAEEATRYELLRTNVRPNMDDLLLGAATALHIRELEQRNLNKPSAPTKVFIQHLLISKEGENTVCGAKFESSNGLSSETPIFLCQLCANPRSRNVR